jgi:hypothetical protein
VINGVASSRKDLSNVCFRNVLSSLVQPYEASEIPEITDTTPLICIVKNQPVNFKNNNYHRKNDYQPTPLHVFSWPAHIINSTLFQIFQTTDHTQNIISIG